ncbi:hypothetical protein GCK72_010179 [Caenorhabditis remanei]|uniref:Uncharacterized protein n=1 Tax=Caenorhabditis remanei TaxID=31234 RepID=A0A6A5H269_CAERE|nr:hypothetical protein GCK72_010179 [Caenorhabditis remanei]KAF1761920.1 hypothetical protein GCK72_010179 [Caenorhabditis remanei]
MTTMKRRYNIHDEKDALYSALLMEVFFVFIGILYFIRFYAALTVYRWTKIPRITANITSSGPKITLQNI